MISGVDKNLIDDEEKMLQQKNELHSSTGEYIKSAVYGGFDGLCTTLIIAVAAIGSASSPSTVIALGIASMIGDGLGMAVADYLGTKSDDEYMVK
jgi:hypothetical protein